MVLGFIRRALAGVTARVTGVHAPSIDIIRTVFPVVALHPEVAGEMVRPDFFGTAFAVAQGVFLTAAHVVEGAVAAGSLGIGGPVGGEGRPLGAARALEWEVWKDRDIALVRCDVSGLTVLDTWLTHRVQVLTDVSAFGYPHAVTRSPSGDRLEVVFRAYKGYVITVRGFERLTGAPAVYEVSSAFPVGLSGAPLLMEKDGRLVVLGVVLGTDTVSYAGVQNDVGIAITGDELFSLGSRMLGGPIARQLNFAGAEFRPKHRQR
jgi:hypothetical protein